MTPAEFQTLRKKANIAQHGLGYTCWEGQLEHFAFLIRKAERELCAKICEQQQDLVVINNPSRIEFSTENMMAKKCASAIRNFDCKNESLPSP